MAWQPHEGRQRPVCSACGNVVYLNPLPAVAAVLLQSGRVLLIKRGVEPRSGFWALPSGFIEQGETPEEAVTREVLEETGAVCLPKILLAATTHDDHIFGHVLVLGYLATHVEGIVAAGDDALEANWFETSALPSMAFASHIDMIRRAQHLLNTELHHDLEQHV